MYIPFPYFRSNETFPPLFQFMSTTAFIQPIRSVFLSSCILFGVSDTIIPLDGISQHVLSLSSN